jgi:hypothetical protein
MPHILGTTIFSDVSENRHAEIEIEEDRETRTIFSIMCKKCFIFNTSLKLFSTADEDRFSFPSQ